MGKSYVQVLLMDREGPSVHAFVTVPGTGSRPYRTTEYGTFRFEGSGKTTSIKISALGHPEMSISLPTDEDGSFVVNLDDGTFSRVVDMKSEIKSLVERTRYLAPSEKCAEGTPVVDVKKRKEPDTKQSFTYKKHESGAVSVLNGKNVIIPESFGGKWVKYEGGYFAVGGIHGNCGLYREDGSEVMSPSRGFYYMMTYDSKYEQGFISISEAGYPGLINKYGVEIISPTREYTSIYFSHLKDGLIEVEKGDYRGICDLFLREIMHKLVAGILIISLLIVCHMLRKNAFRLLVIASLMLSSVGLYAQFRDYPKPKYVDGKYGYVDRDGTYLKKPIYEYATPFYGRLAVVKINGKRYFINLKFEHARPWEPTFNHVTLNMARSFYVEGEGGYDAIYDYHGNALTKQRYSRVYVTYEGEYDRKRNVWENNLFEPGRPHNLYLAERYWSYGGGFCVLNWKGEEILTTDLKLYMIVSPSSPIETMFKADKGYQQWKQKVSDRVNSDYYLIVFRTKETKDDYYEAYGLYTMDLEPLIEANYTRDEFMKKLSYGKESRIWRSFFKKACQTKFHIEDYVGEKIEAEVKAFVKKGQSRYPDAQKNIKVAKNAQGRFYLADGNKAITPLLESAEAFGAAFITKTLDGEYECYTKNGELIKYTKTSSVSNLKESFPMCEGLRGFKKDESSYYVLVDDGFMFGPYSYVSGAPIKEYNYGGVKTRLFDCKYGAIHSLIVAKTPKPKTEKQNGIASGIIITSPSFDEIIPCESYTKSNHSIIAINKTAGGYALIRDNGTDGGGRYTHPTTKNLVPRVYDSIVNTPSSLKVGIMGFETSIKGYSEEPQIPEVIFDKAYEGVGMSKEEQISMYNLCMSIIDEYHYTLDEVYGLCQNNIGACYSDMGDKQTAEEWFRKALECKKENVRKIASSNINGLYSEENAAVWAAVAAALNNMAQVIGSIDTGDGKKTTVNGSSATQKSTTTATKKTATLVGSVTAFGVGRDIGGTPVTHKQSFQVYKDSMGYYVINPGPTKAQLYLVANRDKLFLDQAVGSFNYSVTTTYGSTIRWFFRL